MWSKNGCTQKTNLRDLGFLLFIPFSFGRASNVGIDMTRYIVCHDGHTHDINDGWKQASGEKAEHVRVEYYVHLHIRGELHECLVRGVVVRRGINGEKEH